MCIFYQCIWLRSHAVSTVSIVLIILIICGYIQTPFRRISIEPFRSTKGLLVPEQRVKPD